MYPSSVVLNLRYFPAFEAGFHIPANFQAYVNLNATCRMHSYYPVWLTLDASETKMVCYKHRKIRVTQIKQLHPHNGKHSFWTAALEFHVLFVRITRMLHPFMWTWNLRKPDLFGPSCGSSKTWYLINRLVSIWKDSILMIASPLY